MLLDLLQRLDAKSVVYSHLDKFRDFLTKIISFACVNHRKCLLELGSFNYFISVTRFFVKLKVAIENGEPDVVGLFLFLKGPVGD